MLREAHPRTFVALAILFTIFVLFLYGPTITIAVLSFQGPDGGLMFPINGFSLPLVRRGLPPPVGGRHPRQLPALADAGPPASASRPSSCRSSPA